MDYEVSDDKVAAIAVAMRKLADELDGATTAMATGPALSHDTPFNLISDLDARLAALKSVWGPDGICIRDYWVRGDLGVKVGARKADWDRLWQTLAWLRSGSMIPMHLSVLTAPVNGMSDPLFSVGDIGWSSPPEILDGESYRYNPDDDRGTNMRKWIAHGCPHRNSAGSYADDGSPSAAVAAQWEKWIAALGGR